MHLFKMLKTTMDFFFWKVSFEGGGGELGSECTFCILVKLMKICEELSIDFAADDVANARANISVATFVKLNLFLLNDLNDS